jgi:hypothetical protein
MRVIVSLEYDVDIEGLDPKFVDIEGFAKNEAKRMLEDDIINGLVTPDDFDYNIPLKDRIFPQEYAPPLGISGKESKN